MMVKPGKVYYAITITDDGKITVENWVVRTVRGGKITAIWKLPYTWGKRSTKNGDFGWLKNIPTWCRRTWKVDTEPYSIFTTKRRAIQYELKHVEPGDYDTPEQYAAIVAKLKRMKP
jgi:hypothetical protein